MPVTVVNPDAVMAEVDVRMGRVKTAAPGVVPRNPAIPAMAVVPWDPDPVVPLVPVAPAMIIRPIPDTDREIERFRLRHQRRGYRHDGCQKNQNFLFHTLFDYLLRELFTVGRLLANLPIGGRPEDLPGR